MRRLTPKLGVLLGVALLAAAACGRGADAPRALVLIVIDTLRADHLGSYGYTPARTPVLDALAARGTRFADAMTPVPVTLPAITSLLTGRLPFHHGVRDNERYVLSGEELTLAERFREAGWRTEAVVGSAILAADRGLAQGFERYDAAFGAPFPVYTPSLQVFAADLARTQRRADVVTDRALAALAGFGDAPFFLFVHYFDVHSYYDPPPLYAALHPKRLYDGEVSFVDAEIGRLLEGLAKHRDALVVVVSDHGEGLGEHGETEHGFLLHQSTLQVAFLAAGPDVPAGLVRTDPVSLVDLEPTLAAIFRLPEATPPRDGRALRWNEPETTPPSLYAETCRTLVSYGWSELRALRRERWKLIAGPRNDLYDLKADPAERNPGTDPARASAMREEIAAMTGGETREAILGALHGEIDPGRRELLESLGYIAGTDLPAAPGRVYSNPADELPRWEEAQKRKALYRRGVTFASQGALAEAIALFDSVLVAEPTRADVFYNRALARRKLGDEAGFRRDLAAALRADERYVAGLTLQASVDAKDGRGPLAVERWKKALQIEPGNVDALRGLSEWYLKQSAFLQALPPLRSLVSKLPGDAPARLNLGLAAAKLGRTAEAREHLEAFLGLAPDDPRASGVRQMLSTLP